MTRPSVTRKADEMSTRTRREPWLTSVPVAEHERVRRGGPFRAAEQWEAASRRRPVAVPRPRREPEVPLARRTEVRAPVSRLRGRPPYGYQVVVVPCPDGPAHVLEPDGRTAPVVRRIFSDYLAGHGLQRIAEGLTADTVPCPSAHDRVRNPHHGGFAWSKGAVRAILVNPRYAGVSKWDDGEPGCQPPEPAYEPLVEPSVFQQVQQEFAAKRHARGAAPDRGLRAYVFRGLLRCSICNRLMQGAWNNDEAYYRCRIPEEYATANRIAHPRNVYLRERRLQPALDSWLVATCTPARLVQLVRAGQRAAGRGRRRRDGDGAEPGGARAAGGRPVRARGHVRGAAAAARLLPAAAAGPGEDRARPAGGRGARPDRPQARVHSGPRNLPGRHRMTQTQLSRDDLQELVADILDVEPEALTDDSHFVDDFGVDSLIALELAVALERKYGVRIAEEEIAQVRRMPDVVALVQRKVGG